MTQLENYAHLSMQAQFMVVEIFESCKAEVERGKLEKKEIAEALQVLLDSWNL